MSVFCASRIPTSGHKPPNPFTQRQADSTTECQGLVYGGGDLEGESFSVIIRESHSLSPKKKITLIDSIVFISAKERTKHHILRLFFKCQFVTKSD